MNELGPPRARIDIYDPSGEVHEELFEGEEAWQQAGQLAHEIGEIVTSGYALALPSSPEHHDLTYVPDVFWPERARWLREHDGTTYIQRVFVVMRR